MALRHLVALVVAATLPLAPLFAEASPTGSAAEGAEQPKIALMGPGLRVSDLEAAARFYRDGLGLSIVGRVPLGELEELILGFGPDRRPPFLFLVGPKDAKSQERDEGPKSPGRIVFAVSNAQAAHARLLSAGYAPDPIKVHEASGTILFWATDPDGYRLEITQPGQSGAQGGEHG